MKKVYIFIIIILVVISAIIFWPKKAQGPSMTTNETTTENKNINLEKENSVSKYSFPGVLTDVKIKSKKAVILTEKGTIEFELYADKAPKSVSNFVYLTELGYFDKLTFHRVVPGFVIQGGDPSGNGTGGPGYQFPDETVAGDYKAGTVAMANSGPDTNGSQFFICLDDQPNLPKDYNLFGQVTAGMDIVKQIKVGDKMLKVTIEDLK